MLGLKDILLEGRVEDAQQYFEKTVGDWPVAEPNNQAGIGVGTNLDGVLKHFTQNDPSGNNKYLMWMVKMYVNPEERGTSPNDISSLVQRFHKNVDRLSPVLMMDLGFANPRLVTSPKNLDSYEDIAQLERVMDEVDSIQTRKEKETEAKEGVDKLYEDERWLLVKPNTYEGSCYYGSSTKWCTASKDYPKHFKDYTSTGNLFYIIDKSQDLGDFYKIALYKKFKDGSEEWYDRADNKLSDQTEGAIYSMLPGELVSAFVDAHAKYEKPKPGLKDLEAFKVELENYVMANKKLRTINTESGIWRLHISEGVWYWYSTPDPSSQEQFIHTVQATPFWDGRNEIPFDLVDGDSVEMSDWSITAGPESMENEYITQSLYLDRDPEPGRHEDYGVRVFLSQIYFPLVKQQLGGEVFQTKLGVYATWQPESYVSSYKFIYPPREGTMTRKFVDYLKQNPKSTANKFYEDVLGYPRPRGHNAMFFASIKDSGIVKMERQGRQFVYSLGPNYQEWVEGRLLRR
jgi:hypothetical protein|tara:strand:+ start:500 stop:2047 length:1548 start_codon:yes stop_codon:yes gene_type:complete